MKRLWSALLAVALAGCGEWSGGMAVRPWQETRELVALVPNGPTTLFVNAAGTHAGLEYDLVNQFAAKHGLKVRFLVTGSQAEAMERLQRREAHLAVGVLRGDGPGIQYGPAYQAVEPVLVFQQGRLDSEVKQQLAEGRLMLSTLPEYLRVVAQMKAQQPGLLYEVSTGDDAESLFERVARGEVPVALVDAHTADVMQNYYPKVSSLHGISEVLPMAWALGDAGPQFSEMVESFFNGASEQGVIARLADRYYGHVNRLGPPDTLAFLDKRTAILPDYRGWFHEAEAKTGLDWRLIAALAYQESHWNPAAVSPFGVRGVMMLTEDTARSLGVDRLNPYQSIQGGARYLRSLVNAIPQRIPEPDRTWLALAAYNVGMGHLEDARVLAARLKKNPDSWADVKTTLPLLRNPQYFSTVKNGYARGGEPVIFVESLRTYFDILARFEKPYQPRQPMLAGDILVNNPAAFAPQSVSVQAGRVAAL